MDKDLRTLLGRRVRSRYTPALLRRRLAGRLPGVACGRRSRPRAIELAAAQGPDPRQWRSDATLERIKFSPGLIPNTMRWTNRPTFQQVLRFGAKP